ncbi:MAG: helix-turn-helix domain-containing protein [Oscillospiraceae bacterium]
MEKLLKVLTDPVSNKILQMIRTKKQAAISEILAENPNVPRATLYRKIEKMLEVGAIYVAQTRKVRGQIENIYAIKDIYINSPQSEDGMKIVTMSLMQIIGLYDKYFQSDNADVERDKLFLLNYAVELSDEDFSEMMKEILGVVDKYQKKQSENARLRNLYFISAPKGEDDE